ncbi:uncharacterized protein Tco025E_07188 [Trypanosoma conorhini]|uniref:Uncharacterized protein n=1 Tax=Trypanosoma conorhini TaxID=83891 RepID=A0A3R7NLT8_9TRYP|nr:uncharacterized protein Tco025E_07188 [Trypanosoma conorhini]RNF08362.1 hypothetical protein Tco025E_07188 [Trypanosoma conorhini]
MSLPSLLSSASSHSRLRVVQRGFLTRRGGRHVPRAAVAVEYRPAEQKKIGDGNYQRVIDAESLHGDEQRFWGARRDYYTRRAQYFPTWDRFAQALILMTRHVPRVPQEMAFRLMAVFLKLMLLPRLVVNAELMLPSWVAANAEGLITQAVGDEEGRDGGDAKRANNKEETAGVKKETPKKG